MSMRRRDTLDAPVHTIAGLRRHLALGIAHADDNTGANPNANRETNRLSRRIGTPCARRTHFMRAGQDAFAGEACGALQDITGLCETEPFHHKCCST